LKLARGAEDKERAMSQKINSLIAVLGIDIGKNSFHIVGLDQRGAMTLRQKWSRREVVWTDLIKTKHECERDEKAFPNGGNTEVGQRGSGHLAASLAVWQSA
jgi:hypothetical protein